MKEYNHGMIVSITYCEPTTIKVLSQEHYMYNHQYSIQLIE